MQSAASDQKNVESNFGTADLFDSRGAHSRRALARGPAAGDDARADTATRGQTASGSVSGEPKTRMTNGRRSIPLAATVILIGSIVLLFARLGHYALWDDEAITAMTARAVWQTGDTSVRVDDHNLLVYRNGLLVRDFKDRYTSPLQFYLIAPFIGLLGESNFVCRLPMVLCGLVTVGVFLLWLRKANPPPLVWWAAAVVLLSNASFFLFFRQCRYYGLATMLTALVAYLYCNRESSGDEDTGSQLPVREQGHASRSSILHPRSSTSFAYTAGLAVCLAALLAAQYLDYAAVVGCLVVDYLIWGRKKPFTMRHWLIILLPQVIVGSVVLSIWNPLAQQSGNHYHSPNWLLDRLYLLWWNWRDMIGCDFVVVPLLGICPLLYLLRRSNWLLRAPVALFVFIGMIALAVPTSLAQAHNAEVRYLAPALVPCIAIGVVAVWGLARVKPSLRWLMLGIAAASILIQPTPGGASPVLGSTALLYYHELMVPQVESYTPVIDWINANVPAGASIYVQPGYKTYPLMFRAGKAIYAWQLDGDTVTFTPVTAATEKTYALAARDANGGVIASIRVNTPPDSTPTNIASALIDAWNHNPATAKIAMATGESTVTLTSVNPGQSLRVAVALDRPLTGPLPIQTSSVPERSEFRDLPDIHFKGRIAPDYMIRFGTNGESGDFPKALDLLAARGIHYELINTIALNWKDLYRPERIWRSFVTVAPEKGDEIYIYRKVGQGEYRSVNK